MTIKARVLPKFPARVLGTGPIVVTKAGNTYTFSADFDVFGDTEYSFIMRGPSSWAAVVGIPSEALPLAGEEDAGAVFAEPAVVGFVLSGLGEDGIFERRAVNGTGDLYAAGASDPSFLASLAVTNTDGGSGDAPSLALSRVSATPAVNDNLGLVVYYGMDSGANATIYGQIGAQIIDPTNASEDGRLHFDTMIAGTLAARFYIGAGLYSNGVTGGDKGAGTANIATIYENDVRVVTVAGNQTLTGGFNVTTTNAGTKSSGTFTPVPATNNFQRAVNGGAHTLAPPGSDCTMVLQYTNNATAGAVTTSGFTKVTGDALTTTDGDDFLLFVTVCNSLSHLHVQALQ